MQITIEIPDGSDELAELEHVVATVNATAAAEARAAGRPAMDPVTIEQYLTNIAIAPLTKRVRQAYVRHARGLPAAELAAKFGPLANVRKD